MRIGLDVDDTIADTSSIVIEYALLFDKEYKEGKGIVDPEIRTLIGKFDWTLDDKYNFWKLYAKDMAINVKPKVDCKEVLTKLKEEGNEIYIVTYRTKERFEYPYELTEEWLKKEGIPYDVLIADSGPKGIVCKENNIDVLIDDGINHCTDALNNGIRALLFESKYNKIYDIERVLNWKEVYEKLGRR
jgi:uncharacterized HAD superfamily protein